MKTTTNMVPYLEKNQKFVCGRALQLMSYYKVMEGYQNFQS